MSRQPLTWSSVLLAGVLCLPAHGRAEPVETLLHDFFRSTGSLPQSPLIEAGDGNLYGTASGGPLSGAHCGTIYRQTFAGEYTVLHKFVEAIQGCSPLGGVVQGGDGSLYGTTSTGGAAGLGTLYRLGIDGRFTVLDDFDGRNGASPTFSLLLTREARLYGVTRTGGLYGNGTIFRVGPGGHIDPVHDFRRPWSPSGPLMQAADGSLYGVASYSARIKDPGILYRLSPTDGFSVVYRFPPLGSGGGFGPVGSLIQGADGGLYGVTAEGGLTVQPETGLGTVFRFADGDVTVLHRFTGADGAHPVGGVVADAAGRLFGTTQASGAVCCGTVWRLDPDGSLAVLHAFAGGSGDGDHPLAGVHLGSDGLLYGTTAFGGEQDSGTLFRVTGF